MAWYEAHQTLSRHPRTLRLARLLKTDRRCAVGLLHDLFAWGLDAAGKYGELPGRLAPPDPDAWMDEFIAAAPRA